MPAAGLQLLWLEKEQPTEELVLCQVFGNALLSSVLPEYAVNTS